MLEANCFEIVEPLDSLQVWFCIIEGICPVVGQVLSFGSRLETYFSCFLPVFTV